MWFTFHNAFFGWPKGGGGGLILAVNTLPITAASVFSLLFLQHCFSCKESAHLSITDLSRLSLFGAQLIKNFFQCFFLLFFDAF